MEAQGTVEVTREQARAALDEEMEGLWEEAERAVEEKRLEAEQAMQERILQSLQESMASLNQDLARWEVEAMEDIDFRKAQLEQDRCSHEQSIRDNMEKTTSAVGKISQELESGRRRTLEAQTDIQSSLDLGVATAQELSFKLSGLSGSLADVDMGIDKLRRGWEAKAQKEVSDHKSKLMQQVKDEITEFRNSEKNKVNKELAELRKNEMEKIKYELAESRTWVEEAMTEARQVKERADRHVSEMRIRHDSCVEASLATHHRKKLELDVREKALDARKVELDSVGDLWSIQQEIRSMKHHVDDLASRSFSEVRSAEARTAGLEQELALARATEADLREQIANARCEPSSEPLRIVLSKMVAAFSEVQVTSNSEVSIEELVFRAGPRMLNANMANHFKDALRTWRANNALEEWLCVERILQGKTRVDCFVDGRCGCKFHGKRCLQMMAVDAHGVIPRRMEFRWQR